MIHSTIHKTSKFKIPIRYSLNHTKLNLNKYIIRIMANQGLFVIYKNVFGLYKLFIRSCLLGNANCMLYV